MVDPESILHLVLQCQLAHIIRQIGIRVRLVVREINNIIVVLKFVSERQGVTLVIVCVLLLDKVRPMTELNIHYFNIRPVYPLVFFVADVLAGTQPPEAPIFFQLGAENEWLHLLCK
jgi:hypothetical protein